MGNPLA